MTKQQDTAPSVNTPDDAGRSGPAFWSLQNVLIAGAITVTATLGLAHFTATDTGESRGESAAHAAASAQQAEPWAAAAPEPESRMVDGEEFLDVSLAYLASYPYQPADAPPNEATAAIDADASAGIPPPIRALDGVNALVTGYMMPLDINGIGRVTRFALVRDHAACCLGVTPELNEWIAVEAQSPRGAEFLPETRVAVRGALKVGEEIRNGQVTSLYRMRAAAVEKAAPLENGT